MVSLFISWTQHFGGLKEASNTDQFFGTKEPTEQLADVWKTILAQVKVLVPCIPPRLYSRKRKVHRREVVRKTLWNFLLTCDKFYILESLVAQRLKHLPLIWEIWVRSLGREDPLEKEMATHSSILTWRIPWTEEPGGLQSMGSQRVGHDWVT